MRPNRVPELRRKTETIAIGGVVKLVSGNNAGEHARITRIKGKEIIVELVDAPVIVPTATDVELPGKPLTERGMEQVGKKRGRKRIEVPSEVLQRALKESDRSVKGVQGFLAKQGIKVSAYVVRRIFKERKRGGRKRIDIPSEVLVKAYEDGGRTVKGARKELAKQGITVCTFTLGRLLHGIGIVGWNKVNIPAEAFLEAYKEGGESIRGAQKVLAKRGIAVGTSTIHRALGKSGKRGVKKIDVPPEVLLKAYKEGGGTVKGTQRVLTGQGMKISSSTVCKRLNELRMTGEEMLEFLSRKD